MHLHQHLCLSASCKTRGDLNLPFPNYLWPLGFFSWFQNFPQSLDCKYSFLSFLLRLSLSSEFICNLLLPMIWGIDPILFIFSKWIANRVDIYCKIDCPLLTELKFYFCHYWNSHFWVNLVALITDFLYFPCEI